MTRKKTSPVQQPDPPNPELQREMERRAEIDALVQPVIEARVRVFLPSALAAAKGGPIELHSDDVSASADEQDRRDRRAERANRQRLIRQLLHRTLTLIVELVPSVTRKDLVAYISESLRGAGRHHPRAAFDPGLVERAHSAILKTRPDLGCREACQEIATRLRVSRKTIENLRSCNK